jgi:hypothetical protein
MNTKFTKEQLAQWIEDIKEAAKDDTSFSIAWFKETEDAPFSIIAGWAPLFAEESEVSDLFCCSKSHPEYVMCIKIAQNEGPYAYIDYEFMDMPTDPKTGEVDNTEVMLEWDDPADYAAEFFTHEWKRIMEEYGEKI